MYIFGCFMMFFAVVFYYYYSDVLKDSGMDDGELFFTCAILIFLWPITVPGIAIFEIAMRLAKFLKK